MKPRTKIENIVCDRAKRFPKLTPTQIDYADDYFFPKKCYRTKNTAFCLECGSSIDVKTITRKKVVCGTCKAKLKVETTNKRTLATGPFYMAVAWLVYAEHYEFQVIRLFEFKKQHKRGEKAILNIQEVNQNWYNIDGRRVINSLLYESSRWYGSLEIRKESYWKDYNIMPDMYCPTSKFRDEYEMKGVCHKIGPIKLDVLIDKLHSSKVETLLKSDYFNIVAYWSRYEIKKYWPTLKICMRNQYKIKQPRIYIDMLDALLFLNKDLRNHVYVCPKSLKKAHDYYIDLKNRKELKNKIESNAEIAEKANPIYINDKKPFFNLKFKSGPITVTPLKSVNEFLEEGELLKHCVFKNAFYSKKDSLIMSARIKGKPIETIEVNLKTFEISQCYGYKNTKTKFHSQIIKLVKDNILEIKKFTTPN